MESKKSIWTSITGGLTSAAPVLLSCCKSGACIGVCASPVASLFGISSAAMANSPWIAALEPLLIAVSAVSFTISYYSLYVLPKLACATPQGCACEPTAKEKRRTRINKFVFWLGLILSIGFLTYFEYSKYQQASMAASECSPTGCEEPSEECCSSGDSTACTTTSAADSTSSCCEDGAACEKDNRKISSQSTITCPKCAHKKTETLPTEVCLLSYTCENCKTVLHPKADDCCVFCSYGDHKCPSKQPANMSCKLTSPELQKRKETVLADLRKQVIEKKELKNGYAFKFKSTDKMLEQLNEFIKTERQCCDFFTFGLSVSGNAAWLELTGEDGVKDFISTELGLLP